MQEKVEIVTNHFGQFWTKILKNRYCGTNEIEVILSLQLNSHPTSTTVSKDIFANLFSKNKSLENLTKLDADKRGRSAKNEVKSPNDTHSVKERR